MKPDKKVYIVHDGKSVDIVRKKLTESEVVELRREGKYVHEG